MSTPNVDLYAPPLSPAKLRFTAADPFMPTYIERVVTHQNANARDIYQTRVHGRMLLLDNTAKQTKWRQEMKSKKEKERLAKERRKLGPTGRRQGTARAMGLWSCEPSQAKFALFLPLHQLWLDYMSELLNLPQPGSGPPRILSGLAVHPRLVKADFHGSIITVHQTKNSSILGMSGIVIHETEGTHQGRQTEECVCFASAGLLFNASVVLPKRNSVFTFALPVFSTLPASHTANATLPLPIPQNMRTVLGGPHVTIWLCGDQFCYCSADRAGRKFKAKETIEL
ncbi:POP4 domain-containing protein [Mycena chlorophos]|uniref:POP4 domain-containing protein n=1 Tax=Mycena chlorophos TaxID=658473 RepID=A0A8H6TQZ0_MYCCL|nr:POP4 domain-containing protein [Mycena chlorophos]